MLNDYLLRNLFVNLEENKQYRNWFSQIWDNPNLMVEFLKQAGTQSQKTLAMDIVRQMTSATGFSIPHSVFVNLVEVEHQGDDHGWINQDHSVHSVNLLLFSMLLFFFYSPMRRQLLWHFANLSEGNNVSVPPLDDATYNAIRCLRFSSLYHDLGYTLELPSHIQAGQVL